MVKLLLLLTILVLPAWVPSAYSAEPSSASVTLGDYQPFTKDAYFAFMAPFNAGYLVRGKDYTDNMIVHTSTFPNGTLVDWTWPSAPCPIGVYNFLSVQYGDYYNTHPEVPIPSRKVNEIATLTERHDLAIGGSLQGFDVIIDFFLTSLAGGDSPHEFEIEIFLHTPKYGVSFVNRSSPIGTYQDANGGAWTVAINKKANDVLFMPTDHADMLSATLDIKAMLYWLISTGTITGNESFNGLAIGSEVRQNEGSLAINWFSVTYD